MANSNTFRLIIDTCKSSVLSRKRHAVTLFPGYFVSLRIDRPGSPHLVAIVIDNTNSTASWLRRVVNHRASSRRGETLNITPVSIAQANVIQGWPKQRYERARDTLLTAGLSLDENGHRRGSQFILEPIQFVKKDFRDTGEVLS